MKTQHTPKMIKINSITFAKNDSQMIDSLFEGEKTSLGFYKIIKKDSLIHLSDLQKNVFAAIVKNKQGFISIVNCHKTESGKFFYQQALSGKMSETMQVTYKNSKDLALSVFEQLNKGSI